MLCKFYVIWKLHKPANVQGVRTRPISPNIGYPTGQISNFLHSQLAEAVFMHPHVLKDSLSLIRMLENMNLSPDQEIFLTSADIAAPYPSINIEDGLEAMRWFMKEHTNIPDNLQKLYLRLARFVLENNYVECRGLSEGCFFRQKIGTAMGTSFSVTYATIFMIWLETPIVNEFRQHILLYKRFLDDVFVVWSGSIPELCRFHRKFRAANPNIKLEWQGIPLETDATNPAKFDSYKHRRVNFLDLDARIVYTIQRASFEFSVYRKPGNAFSNLPYGSYHARHVFRGWLKAEVLRLLTHSSTPTIWIEECRRFYDHLRRRGYPAAAISSTFRKVSWSQRQHVLNPKMKSENEIFFATYRGCVFSTRNAPGSDQLKGTLDLSLKALQEDSEGGEIFPARGFFATKSAFPMGYALRKPLSDFCDLNRVAKATLKS